LPFAVKRRDLASKKFYNIDRQKVPVSDCDSKYFNSQEKIEMALGDYVDYWKNRDGHPDRKCLYLKDWHFRRDCPGYSGFA
jgi:hypothetical protein